MAGVEEVDIKWFNLSEKLLVKKNFDKLSDDYFSSQKSIFYPNWAKKIDPFQSSDKL